MSSFDNFWDEFQDYFGRAPGLASPGRRCRLGEVGVIDRRGYLHGAPHGFRHLVPDLAVTGRKQVLAGLGGRDDARFRGLRCGVDPAGALTAADLGMRVTFSASGGFVVRCPGEDGTTIAEHGSGRNADKGKTA